MKNIVRFLFPELFIVDDIKNKGFYRKGKIKDITDEKKSVPDQPQIGQNTPEPMPLGYTKEIRIEGQRETIAYMIRAFNRPIILGYDQGKLKNTIFLSGKLYSGKNQLVRYVIQELYREYVLTSDSYTHMDLSIYKSNLDYDLFLTDLYAALNSYGEVVIIENIEIAPSFIISILSSMISFGFYKLKDRYTYYNNMLVKVTGTLTASFIDSIGANDKYFVFLTTYPINKVSDLFSGSVIEQITDFIAMQDYTDDEILAIIVNELEDMQEKCRSNLSIDLHIGADVPKYCFKYYKPATMLLSIINFINNDIYNCICEFKLKTYFYGELELLINDDNNLYLTDKINIYPLKDYQLQKYKNSFEDIQTELNSVIGLTDVKNYIKSLEDHHNIQRLRQERGIKSAPVSSNMIFAGNPGTGKTMIARILSKYLKAAGLLSSGQLREATRADLVGEYVGQTARLTREIVESARGGILFIDEAYSICRNKNDTFGVEAVDTIVKCIDDYKDDLVVILAGYDEEMKEFLKMNPGLNSRFPNNIHFPDYTPDEMCEISEVIAKSKGYKIDPGCYEYLKSYYEKSNIKGRNDAGNGRLARNTVENAIIENSKRLTTGSSDEDFVVLIKEDFGYAIEQEFDLEKELSKIIGLENVKELIRNQAAVLMAGKKRREANVSVNQSQNLNMLFTGNAGTGKTTVARVVANLFKEMGVLKKGHLIEVDKSAFVSKYVGGTAQQTLDIFKDALGGVLFIDEAYSLGGQDGKDAVDTLIKLVEDYRNETVVILAGYKEEMRDFMNTNSGLQSRFPLVVDFPDYTSEELYQIGLMMFDSKGFTLTDGAKIALKDQINYLHSTAGSTSGNARMVRNFMEKVMRNQSVRIASNDVEINELNMIIEDDIAQKRESLPGFDLEATFSKIIGLDPIKNYVRSLNARLNFEKARKSMNLASSGNQTLHMIFAGNPGTGKTMIARVIANVLYSIGIIRTNNVIETDRSGLVAGYVGQTALKTSEKIQEALDGVLIIDEAYALSSYSTNDFGQEAIDTLVKMMDDNRERLVVILAGYSKEMKHFLDSNSGLKSRFPNFIEFPDYNEEELLEIIQGMYKSHDYQLTDKAVAKLLELFKNAKTQKNFGNGRFARNIFERSINEQAMRLSTIKEYKREDLVQITDEDIKEL